MPSGFYPLIVSQFVSALADNALLLVAIALLQMHGHAAFWVPLLKLLFTLSYVVFGPWVGAIADTWPKHKILRHANALKWLACVGMLMGLNPMMAYSLTGLGAALFSPAKYGWITETVETDQLLQANSWIEVTTVCAALFGVMLGGWLVSADWLNLSWVQSTQVWWSNEHDLFVSLAVIASMYGMSSLLMAFIPHSNKTHGRTSWDLKSVWQHFRTDQLTLWKDPLGFISLSVTTLFWGVSACMQLLILAWSQTVLQTSLSQAAYLQACTAIGVMAGALLAGHSVTLPHATKVLRAGLWMALLLPLMTFIHHWLPALCLTLAIGALGGYLVVPMNALLQARGAALLSAGRSISVQNTCENSSILVLLALYSALTYFTVNVSVVIIGLSVLVGGGMVCLIVINQRHTKNPSPL